MDISREEAEDELLADATDVFWKGDKDAEAAVKTLVEKTGALEKPSSMLLSLQ
ncbi:hypothetical protein [Mogibacterium timidum]|uniref:hypothetical protein n=1 Tax=Mogibacterium timidum TaxID=35519 RepID=UPI00248B5FF2|nr:hypothetical protein [Mogibacterium timidum]